jgi:hypothetical protein
MMAPQRRQGSPGSAAVFSCSPSVRTLIGPSLGAAADVLVFIEHKRGGGRAPYAGGGGGRGGVSGVGSLAFPDASTARTT